MALELEARRKLKLKEECLQVKKLSYITSFKIIPGQNEQFVCSLHFSIDAPLHCKVDIPQLAFSLTIHSFSEQNSISIVLNSEANSPLPQKLLEQIELSGSSEYKRLLSTKSIESDNWFIINLVEWFYSSYVSLVSSIPSVLESYMGEGENGESIRRWALIEVEQDEDSADVSDSSNESDDEEAREYWRLKRLEEEMELEAQKAREAEERRREVENDPNLHVKMKKLSVKEQLEIKEARNKQGMIYFKSGLIFLRGETCKNWTKAQKVCRRWFSIGKEKIIAF